MSTETQIYAIGTCAIGICANRSKPQESNSPESENIRNITYEFISEKCKTKPICLRSRLMQTHYLQRIKKIYCSIRAQKTKPKQTQSNPISKKPK